MWPVSVVERDDARVTDTTDRVTCTVKAGVADVRLARPDKLNALDLAMFTAIVGVGEELKADPTVRAVVLSGEGRGFCAGLDLASLVAMASKGSGDHDGGVAALGRTDGRITHLAQQACWVWAELEVPVLAAVHGVCLGGGLQLALGADLRIVASDARLSVLEIRWGLIPDMIGTYVLPRLVGPDVAKELAWTGREVGGAEAVAIGLATRTAEDPRADALALAADLAGRSPHAIRAAKRLIGASLERSPAEQFAAEREEIARLVASPNQLEAIAAAFERRGPVDADAADPPAEGTVLGPD